MVMQFGQFLDHDISSTSFPEKRCCLNPSRPECFNINVPESDPSFPMRKNTSMSCIDFARSRPACGQPGREQVNTITAFIDCSNVYGSEDDLAGDLRARVGGRERRCGRAFLRKCRSGNRLQGGGLRRRCHP